MEQQKNIKLDAIDIMLNDYKEHLKDLLTVINKPLTQGTTEYKEAKSFYDYQHKTVEIIGLYVNKIFRKCAKEKILKQRHKKQYVSCQKLEEAIKKCVELNFLKSVSKIT